MDERKVIMNYYKPTLGIEPTDKYEKAKQDILQALNSVQALTPQERQRLAEEMFRDANVTVMLNILHQAFRR